MRRIFLALIMSALTLSANATNFYSASTGNLENTATWWSNSDGATGTHPSNFTANSQVFNIINNTAPTIASGWTVSGTASKIIVGDGVAAVNFTIPSTASVTGIIDVAANAILTISNAVGPTLGTLNASSTVNYNSSTGGQAITGATYGNLIIGNSSNTNTASGPLRVNGALTTTSGGTLAMAGFQLLGTLTSVTNNGTITTTNTMNPAIPTGKNWTGITGLVNFAATTGGQFIPAGTYGAITLSNSSSTNTAAGIVTVNGALTTTSGGTLAMATFQLAGSPASVTNNGTITTSSIANPALPAGQNWSGTTGLVTFTVVGGGQFIPAGTYKDLTLNNIAGTNTAVGVLTVNGALTNTSGGILALSTYQLAGSLAALTNNGTITTLSTDNPAIPSGKNWTGTTGVVTFAATTGGQFIPAGTYKTLTCSNTSATNTAGGTLTVNNALTTTSGGTLAMSAFQLLGSITTLTNNGTITTACTTDPAIPTGRSWSGTTGLVNFAATTGGQSIPAGTYKGLTVSNTAGTTTADGILTVNGVLTTTAGSIADLSTFQLLGTPTSIINNGTISTSATANPAIPTGMNWAGSGLVNFAATTGGQFIPAGTYSSLTLSNSSNTNTATGLLRVNGALTTTSGGTLAMSTFQLAGTPTSVTNNGTVTTSAIANPALPANQSWTGTTGLVSFGAAAGGQFIPPGTYKDLTLNNTTGTNTAVGILTVNGALTNTSGGILALSTYQLAGSLATLTNNGTITTLSTDNPAIPSGKNWSGTTGVVTFAATTGGQFIPAGTYKTLTCSNTSATNTAVGALTVTNALTTTSAGTLAMSTFQLLGTMTTLTNNGTIITACTTDPAIPTGRNWSGATGLVNFAATTGAQFIPAGTYKGLTVSNTSGTTTADGIITVNGVLTTMPGSIADLSTFQLLGTLTSITNNGTISTSATANPAIPTGENWTGAGVVNFAATTGGQFIPAGTYGSLTLSNSSNTNTATGALRVNGALTTTSGGVLAMAGFQLLGTLTSVTNNGTITVTNTTNPPIPTGKNWTGTTGLVNFAAATGGQFIPAGTYGALTLGNSSNTNTAAGIVTVNGALTTTSGGTLAMATFQLAGTPTSVTNNGTVTTSSTANPALPAGESWTGTTGLVSFGAAAGGQFIPAGTYKTLTCSNTSGTNAAAGNLNVTGTITTSGAGGTLDMGTNTLAAAGVTNTGTILTQNTSSAPLPPGLTWAGMVNYNGTDNQTMVTGTFVNLALSGARVSTPAITLASGAISLSGSFTVAYTGDVSFTNTGNTFIYTGNTTQTVGGITYNNLSCMNTIGTAPKNAGGNIAVDGILTTTSGGTLAMGNYQLSGSSATITNNGAISTACTLNPALPTGKNWGGTTGLVTFTATAGGQYIPGGTYKTLTCSNTSDINTVTGGPLMVTGVLTTSGAGGSLDMGTNELSATTITTNSTGTLMTECTTATPLPSGHSYSGTVNYNATAGGQTIIQGTYKNLTVGNTTDTSQASGNLVVNGTLLTNGGSLKMGAFTLSGNAGFASSGTGTITTANTSATPLTTGTTWAQTILYNGTTGAQTIVAGTYNAGLINANPGNTNTAAGDISISGNLTLAGGSVLNDGGFQLSLNGNIAGTGTHIKTVAGKINMTAGAATISGATLGNLILNNAAGFSLTGDATINGTLTLTSGSLAIGNNNLTLGATAPAIAGSFSSSKMIVINGTGKVRKMYTANGSYLFPLGDNTPGYSPVTLNFTGGSYGSGAYAAVSVTNTKHPDDVSTTNYLNRYWSVAVSGITSPVYSVSATYLTSDIVGNESAISSAMYAGSLPWTKYSPVDTPTNNISATNVTAANADFGGIPTISVSVSVLPASSTICSGDVVALEATGQGLPPFTYSWSPATGLSATTGATVIAAPTVSGTYVYTVTITDAQGSTSTATTTTTVTVLPAPPAITGANAICNGLTTTLNDALAGGTWTSGNESTASITSSDGVLSAIAEGTAVITYTSGNGCFKTLQVTVNAMPAVDPITGPSTLCEGAIDYLVSSEGGIWTSDAPAIVTVDSSTGLVTGISGGSSSISYNVTNAAGCSTTVTTNIVINPKPHVEAITGTSSICFGTTTLLSEATTGGSWLSADSTLAAVDSAGTVTGTVGVAWDTTVNIMYIATNDCGSDTAQKTITIKGLPGVGMMVATNDHHVCLGATALYSSTHPGGVWSMSDATIASIDSVTGLLTGLSVGSTTISYTVTGSNGCAKSRLGGITVNSLPLVPTIYTSGLACTGSTITLTGTTGPASTTWTSSDTTIAAIDSNTGVLIGKSVGTAVITYEYREACSSFAQTVITVNPTTTATVTGTPVVCASGGTTVLTGAPGGGTWSSSNVLRATVDTSGFVTGVGAGSATTTYVYTNSYGCNSSVNTLVTVNAIPTVGSVTGASGLCQGTTGLFTNPTTGGVWSTSDASIATVGSSSGIVTGVAPGVMIVSYTVTGTNGCPKSSKLTVTVNALPSVSAIVAGTGKVCTASTLALTNATSGTHLWTSNNVSAATVNSSTGLVTGVAAGTATISYKYTNGCSNYAATVVTVNAVTTASVTGTRVVCAGGSTTTLTGAPGSGIWSSSTPAKALVDSTSGTVTGVASGTATITFKYTNGSGCIYKVYTPVTVNALPSIGGISGTTSVCVSAATTLTDATAGGVWSSAAPTVGSVSSAGMVTGISAGTTKISYTVTGTNGCNANATKTITVNALPTVAAIAAGSGSISAGAMLSLYDATTGTHVWSSSNTAAATVNSSTGVVTGIAAGSATITYAFTSGCTNYATTVVKVTAGARPAIAETDAGPRINAAISVYPNPTSGTYSVQSDGGYLAVYSLEGKEIVKYVLQAGVSVLSMPANLAAGVYMCVFTDDKGNREIIRLEYRP